MAAALADQIVEKIEHAGGIYHRLVLVVAPAGAGKTAALHEVRERTGAPLVNVNLELSRRMLELTETQRVRQMPDLLKEIVGDGDTVLLDNTEIIFDPGLQHDPLRLLQGLSRDKTVVAAWNGATAGDSVTYAVPGHPEHQHHPVDDFLVASPEMAG